MNCQGKGLRGILLVLGAVASCSAADSQIRGARLPDPQQTPISAAQSSVDSSATIWGAAELIYNNVYYASFTLLLVLTALLAWWTRPQIGAESLPPDFRSYQLKYLLIWGLAIGADWLQGPYVYALYESYGYSPNQIAQLFVAGFGSSMLFGTFMGVIADAWGRKRCAVAYCVLYAMSCVTKHSSNYWFLMLGRVLGGVATSLLFSTFECWMISEHKVRHNFSDALLRYMFGLMFFVQYLTAIVAGVVAQFVADALPLTAIAGSSSWHYGGYTGPFDLSLVCLLFAAPAICYTWDENYGDAKAANQFLTSLGAAATACRTQWRVGIVGLVVATFEGSMYSFIFNWTPALASSEMPPPHGLIFSAFMMACMCGSSIFALTDPGLSPARVLLGTCLVSAIAMGIAAICLGGDAKLRLIFLGFLLFELCVGVYFPAIGTLKSHIVPEEARAGVYNIYRVPLNAVVVAVLLSNVSLQASFTVCTLLLGVASVCLFGLQQPSTSSKEQQVLLK